jgi:hypothetical protein
MSFFRRLFSSGGEAARWQKQLVQSGGTARPGLVRSFALPANDLGPMARLALGLGGLAHEVLEAKLAPLSASMGSDRAGIERAQARLWLQATIPNARSLEAEWRGLADLADIEQHRRTFDHVDAALKATFNASPGRDALARWGRGLVAEVAPLEHGGLPNSLGLTDHAARATHFDGADYVNRVQQAINWFVVVANRLGEAMAREDFTAAGIEAALGGPDTLVEVESDSAGQRDRWLGWHGATRTRMLERGRNDKPAFIEGVDSKSAHRSSAFTGMMNLADLPRDQLPPELQNPSLPPESAVAPPPPAMTQEVPLAMIQQAAAAAGLPPLPLDASGPHMRVQPSSPPAMTQEVSLAMIEQAEAAARGFASPAMTQEISIAQIESAQPAFATPLTTQEVSAVQIDAVMHVPVPLPPPVPPVTVPPTTVPPTGAEDPPRE